MIRSTLLAVGLFAHLSAAETLLVPEQYPDIQSAVNAANDGDEILVGPGEYDQFQIGGFPYENQHPENLSISSTDGPEVTVIQRNPSGPQAHAIGVIVGQGVVDVSGFTIDSFGPSSVGGPGFVSAIWVFGGNASFENMKVTNCNGLSNWGGSADHITYGSATYKNCSFIDCRVANSTICNNNFRPIENCEFIRCEGIITYGFSGSSGNYNTHLNCIFDSCKPSPNPNNPTMFNYGEYQGCEFTNNEYRRRLIQSPKSLNNCTFTNNVHVSNESDSISPVAVGGTVNSYIDNCIFLENTGRRGGALLHDGGNNLAYVSNCTFRNNNAVLIGGAIFASGTLYATNTEICGNLPNNVSGSVIDEGNNTITPTCEAVGSCCFYTGCLPETTLENCINAGGMFFETTCSESTCPEATGACCVGSECVVTTVETCFGLGGSFAGLSSTCTPILCPEECEGDVSGNGDVGLSDLIAVLSNWGPCPG